MNEYSTSKRQRGYYQDENDDEHLYSSRSNKRQAHHRDAYQVVISTSGLGIEDCVVFINNVMREEGLVVGDAVVGFLTTRNQSSCLLEIANTDLVEKVCYLNGIFCCNRPLMIRPCIPSSNHRKFSCWNEYHRHKYQRNDPVVEKSIQAYESKWCSSRNQQIFP